MGDSGGSPKEQPPKPPTPKLGTGPSPNDQTPIPYPSRSPRGTKDERNAGVPRFPTRGTDLRPYLTEETVSFAGFLRSRHSTAGLAPIYKRGGLPFSILVVGETPSIYWLASRKVRKSTRQKEKEQCLASLPVGHTGPSLNRQTTLLARSLKAR